METEEIIKNLIAEINFWGEDEKNNADWNHIISSGILDSLAFHCQISVSTSSKRLAIFIG